MMELNKETGKIVLERCQYVHPIHKVQCIHYGKCLVTHLFHVFVPYRDRFGGEVQVILMDVTSE